MGVPLAYNDTIYTAMNITNGVIDKMILDTRISPEERGRWTLLNTIIDATGNPPASLILACCDSLKGFFAKLVV